MNILITGGTGFIGTALCSRLLEDKHDIVVLSRHPDAIKPPVKGIADLEQLEDDAAFDIVINLAGEPIANKRWSEQQKQRIVNSRVDTTQKLIAYFQRAAHKPKLLVSGSAIGYYGFSKTNDFVEHFSKFRIFARITFKTIDFVVLFFVGRRFLNP